MYGHIRQLAEAEKKGIEKAGGTAELLQYEHLLGETGILAEKLTQCVHRIEETLPSDVLEKMHAPPKDASVRTISDPTELEAFDGWLLGIPTRYGNFPAQWKVRQSPSPSPPFFWSIRYGD